MVTHDKLTETDRRVLAMLVDSGWVLSPKVLAHNIARERHWVNERLLLLRDAGLVERVERGLYRATPTAVKFVDNNAELSAAEEREIENAFG